MIYLEAKHLGHEPMELINSNCMDMVLTKSASVTCAVNLVLCIKQGCSTQWYGGGSFPNKNQTFLLSVRWKLGKLYPCYCFSNSPSLVFSWFSLSIRDSILLSLNESISILFFYDDNELLIDTPHPLTIKLPGSDTSLSIHHPEDFWKPNISKENTFGHFITPCLSDYRSVVFIKAGAHRNYFSGTNFHLQIFIENCTTSHSEYYSKLRDKYHVPMNQTEPCPQVANQVQGKTYWRIIR